MRLYEVVYIFDAAIDEAAVNEKLERYHALVTGIEGEVKAMDHWGIRQLAYPVDKKKTGYYVVAQINGEPNALPEFERVLKLDEAILRYLVVLNEGEPTTGMSILAPRPITADRPKDSDDDDDEDRFRKPASRDEGEKKSEGEEKSEGQESGEGEGQVEKVTRNRPPEFSGVW